MSSRLLFLSLLTIESYIPFVRISGKKRVQLHAKQPDIICVNRNQYIHLPAS